MSRWAGGWATRSSSSLRRDHLFARWDEGEKSFNIDGTTQGFGSYPDEHYRAWPEPFTAEEEGREGFLKSLTSVQELAVFLSIRGQSLRAAKDYKKALGAFAHAFYRQPESVSHQALFAMAEREAFEAGVLPKRQALRYAIQSLEIPPGPLQDHHAIRRLDLNRLLEDTNMSDADLGLQLDRLQSEIAATTRRRGP